MNELTNLKTRVDNATNALDVIATGVTAIWADTKTLVELAKNAHTPEQLAAVDASMTALEERMAKVGTDVTAIDAEFPVPATEPTP